MKDDAVIQHLMDIKERLSKVEANTKTTKMVAEKTDERVVVIEAELNQARGSIKAIKWTMGLLFITVPSVAYTLVRIFNI